MFDRGARNAGCLAVRILGASDPALQQRIWRTTRQVSSRIGSGEGRAALRAELLG
ncbi:hypothetical protein GS461_20485 [Rhodococcus hoagii]|nr:hypothetical protein [Prescottella equi]